MLRDQACEVIQRERIKTTVARAKETRKLVERTITLAKRGVESGVDDSVEAAKRRVYDRLQRKLAVAKVFDVLVDRYRKRAGGYTRIIRLGSRAGDGAEMAYIELVKDEKEKPVEKAKKSAKKDKKSKRSGDPAKAGAKKK